MRQILSHSLIAVSFMLEQTACAEPPVKPQLDALAPFTRDLLINQPEDAFSAVYRIGDKTLIWLGARHATKTESLTFQLIAGYYDQFAVDTVILEGEVTADTPNAPDLIAYARAGLAEEKDGFQPRGETVPAVLGAFSNGAAIYGGEPDDSEIINRLTEQGISKADILGFYTMRSIPQWIRERKIADAGDPNIEVLLKDELAWHRSNLGFSPDILPDLSAWQAWYRAINGKALAADFTTEEAGPRADGRFGTNTIGAAISKARAAHLHEVTISHLNTGQTVLVIYGASHLMIQRPALDLALGAPCYTGADAEQAARVCLE